MELNIEAHRDGDWWILFATNMPGLNTQVKKLSKAEFMVRDAAALLTGDPEESFSVNITPIFEDEDVLAMNEAKKWNTERSKAIEMSTKANKEAIKRFKKYGLPTRDVANLLGISAQSVSVISKA